MPTPLTTFVGRTSELAEVQQLIHSRRLVTVLGPPEMPAYYVSF